MCSATELKCAHYQTLWYVSSVSYAFHVNPSRGWLALCAFARGSQELYTVNGSSPRLQKRTGDGHVGSPRDDGVATAA